MQLELTSAGGRYPEPRGVSGIAKYSPTDVRATLSMRDDTVVIRIDDVHNLARWEELTVPMQALEQFVRANADGRTEEQ